MQKQHDQGCMVEGAEGRSLGAAQGRVTKRKESSTAKIPLLHPCLCPPLTLAVRGASLVHRLQMQIMLFGASGYQ